METKQQLKALWKKLGINGHIFNYSSKALWVLETNTGKSIAHILEPMTKSPIDIDADAFRRVDEKSIEGHKSWWKFYDFSNAEVFDKGGDLRVSLVTKTKVFDQEFGGKAIIYDKSKNWGDPLKLIVDVRRAKSGRITHYQITKLGWMTVEETLSLTCRREIDNARPVFPSAGKPYIRTRKDHELLNNIEIKG